MKKVFILFVMVLISVACGTKSVELGNPNFPDNEAKSDTDMLDDSDLITDSDSIITPDDDSVIDPDDDTVIDPDDDTVVDPDDDVVVQCIIGEQKCDDAKDNVLECNVDHEWVSVADCSAPLKMCVESSADNFFCDDLVCEPGVKFCKNEDVYTCNADGKTDVLSTNCTGVQYCDTTTAPVSCQDMICDPDQLFCDSNVLKLCSSNGGSSTVSKDCGTGVCDEALENCVYTSLIGSESSFSANNGRRGVFYNCTKNVTVIEFAQGFDLSSNTDLTWTIYEAEGSATLYKRIYSKKETVTSNGKGLYSTGAISVSLKSGNKYLFYTGWSGTRNFLFGNAGEHPVDMGFGSSFNGYNQSFSGTPEEEINNPAGFDRTYRQQIKFIE